MIINSDYKFYDFSRAENLPKDAVRAIAYLFENFAREVGTSLSSYLRFIMEISLESVEQIEYGEFITEMPYPTCITIIGLKPLDGTAVLEMSLNLTFLMLDRLLGGKGEFIGQNRAITEIETTIVDRIVEKILDVMERGWAHLIHFDIQIEGRETNPQMAQIASHNERVLMLKFKVKAGGEIGYIKLGIPSVILEPLKDKLLAHQWSGGEEGEIADDTDAVQIRKHLNGVQVPVIVYLGNTTLSLKDIMQLDTGHVIRLMRDETMPVDVLIKNKVTFNAHVGRIGSNKAVKIVSVVK